MSQINVVCAATPANCPWRLRAADRRGGLRWSGTIIHVMGGTVTTAIFDADSHLMETANWLEGYADEAVRALLRPLALESAVAGAAALMAQLPDLWEQHRHQEIGPEVLSGPKGWMAPGALDTGVRSRVLDALAIDAQLVFPTFALVQFATSRDPDVLYGGAAALNRAMADFCAPDPRLKAVGYLPLNDPERALAILEEALALGVAAIWVSSEAPGDVSPAHVDLDPVWARMAEAGVPFVLHVGGGKLLPKAFHNNGLPRPTDWLGGGENLRAKDFPVVHHSPERFLACMALDGVFERHPTLRGAAIELGASWVPALLRNVDHALRSFAKFEPTLQALPLLPSEYLRRQVRFTPFPFEDTAWLIEQCGPDLFMFSTDYPHPEGGRRPFEVFGEAMSSFDESIRERFFWRNGAEHFGLV
jgi:predicted TIM-barrel fold metal-dependent hydrolase